MRQLGQAATAIAAAALIAAALAGFPGLPQASTTRTGFVTHAELPAPQPRSQVDAQRGWPYGQRADNVRLVTTDRLN